VEYLITSTNTANVFALRGLNLTSTSHINHNTIHTHKVGFQQFPNQINFMPKLKIQVLLSLSGKNGTKKKSLGYGFSVFIIQ